jgi:hypothetical protein
MGVEAYRVIVVVSNRPYLPQTMHLVRLEEASG